VKFSNYFPSAQSALIIIAISLLCMAPAFLLGAGGVDLHCQSVWVKLFSAQFWQGDLYPRWIAAMFAGSGSPVFFYYPPLAYFITAFFAPLIPLAPFAYSALAAPATFAVIVSGFTFYAFAKEETGNPSAALLGSLLYIAAPDHLAQNFYHMILFSSVFAYAWIPLLLMSAKKLALGARYAVAAFAVSLFLLIMTNLPMTLMFGAVAVLYAISYFRKETLLRQSARLLLSVLLGFGLSAIYLLPALSYMDFVNIDFHWKVAAGHDFFDSLFFLNFAAAESKLYALYLLASALLAALYVYAAPRVSRRWFFSVVTLLALVMMLPQSKFIWSAVSPLKLLQFTERLFAVTSLCLAMLAALVFPRLRLVSYLLLAVCIAVTWGVAAETRITMESYRKAQPVRYEALLMDVDQYADYLPTPNLMTRYGTAEGLKDVKAHSAGIETLSGDAVTAVTMWRPRDIVFHYRAASPSTLRIRQFYFPGFRAFTGANELDVTPDENTGQILLAVPSGEADIEVTLTALWHEIAGKALSLLSTVILLLCVLLELKNVKKARLRN